MSDIKPPVPWSNTYSKTFVDLLALVTLDYVYHHQIDTNDDGIGDTFVNERAPSPLQSRAVQLLAREFTARLATGSVNYSRDPWDVLYEDMRYTRSSDQITAGVAKADNYRDMATKRSHHANGLVTGPQISDAAYTAELTSVIADASLLAAKVAASAAADAGLDVILAAAIASDFAAARAGYLAELQARFPDRGFV